MKLLELINVLILIQFLMKKLKKIKNLFKKFFGKEVVIVKHVILINMDEYRKNEELAAATILIVSVLVIMIAIVFGIIGFIIKCI